LRLWLFQLYEFVLRGAQAYALGIFKDVEPVLAVDALERAEVARYLLVVVEQRRVYGSGVGSLEVGQAAVEGSSPVARDVVGQLQEARMISLFL